MILDGRVALAHETTTVSGAAFEVGAGGVSRIEVGVGETAPVEADSASWPHGELTVPPVETSDRAMTRWLSRRLAEIWPS